MLSETAPLLPALRQAARSGSPAAHELFLASLLREGEAVLPELEAALADNDARVQTLAVEGLRTVAGLRAVPVLKRAMQSRDLQLRRTAAEGLRTFGPPVVPDLCDLLRHHEWDVRARVVDVLAHLRDARAVPPLCQCLADGHELVRLRAARALGSLHDPAASPLLREALGDESEAVRSAVVAALAALRDTGAIPDLITVLVRRPGAVLRRSALRALLELGLNPRRAEPWLRTLCALENRDSALILVDGRAAVPELCVWVTGEDAALRAAAVRALELVARRDPGPELRTALPVLRSLFRSREGGPLGPMLRGAIRAIESAVGASELPLPSGPAEPALAGLPVPALPGGPAGGSLPRAAAGGHAPLRDRWTWLIRLGWWTWR